MEEQNKTKKPIYKKWWFWLIVIIIIGTLSSMGKDAEPTSASITPTQSQNASTPVPTTEPTPEPTPEKVPTIGDTITIKDIDITLNDLIVSEGKEFFSPDDGKVFLIADITIVNNSNNDVNISSIMSTKAYIDDYVANLDFSAMSAADKSGLDGTIAPGKKLNGVVGYQVPEDWKVFEITIEPSIFSGKTATFKVENK